YFLHNKNYNLYSATFFLSLTVLIRPINGLAIFLIPLFLSKEQSIVGAIKKLSFVNYLVIFLIIGILFFIQSYAWYLQIGEWIIWTYNNEGFYFTHPEITKVLFSFRKGWFIY